MIESLLALFVIGSVLLIPYQFSIVTRVLVIGLLACSPQVLRCYLSIGPWHLSPIRWFGAFALFSALIAFASIAANGRLGIYQDYVDLLTPLVALGVAGLGHWIGLSVPRLHRFALGFFVFMLAFLALNLFQVLDSSTYGRFEWLYSNYTPQHTVEVGGILADRGEANRYSGLSANPNSQASILCLLLVALSVMPSVGCWRSLICIPLSVLFVLAQSRTAIIAMLVSAPVLVAPRTWGFFGIVRTTFILTALGLVLALLVEWLNLTFIRSLISSSLLEQDTLTARFEAWGPLLEMARERPLLGNAPQQEYFAKTATHADSEYVLVFWRYGLIGLAAQLSMMLLPIISAVRLHRGQRSVRVGMACLSIVAGVISLTNVTLTDFRFTVIYSLVLGLCLGRLGGGAAQRMGVG
jgi:hypothetical protein